MKVTRLYTGPNQDSLFEDIKLELGKTDFGNTTLPIDAQSIYFGQSEGPHQTEWHNAPYPVYFIMLQGAVEIEISDGSKRIFKEGDIILAEDTTGQGHLTRGIGDGLRRYIVVPVK